MAAKIIPFPGPKTKTLLDIAEEAGSTIGQVPAAPRPLSAHEVEHRRRMLLHLIQCAGK